jgi:hypothetical protein
MNWYAAHIIMFFKYRQGRQRSFPVWENIVLVRARSADEAFAKAEQLGRDDEACEDESLTWAGHPAKIVFAGVRKLVECVDPDQRPGNGTEVTYNEMHLPSEKAVYQLATGDRSNVTLDEVLTTDDFDESAEARSPHRLAE